MPNGDKPVFITGATGSVGLALARRFADHGREVRALARNLERAKPLQALKTVKIIPGDLAQPEKLRGALDGCSLVYHSAAKLTGANKAEFQAVNVEGTRVILEEACRAGVERFVHVSTVGVYALHEGKNIKEDHPWEATANPYPATKQQAERLVWEMKDQLAVAVARPGDVYGPGQEAWTVKFVELIKGGLLRPPTRATSGLMAPIYIENLLDALVLLGEHPQAVGEAFNVVDSTPILWHDYMMQLAEIAHKRVFAVPAFVLLNVASVLEFLAKVRGREPFATRANAGILTHHRTFSNEKLRTRLGWSPAVDWNESMRRSADWLRKVKLIE